jgi:hypothetical protein
MELYEQNILLSRSIFLPGDKTTVKLFVLASVFALKK